MINAFSDPEQLKSLCDSQFKTIVELSKKIQTLEQENKSLRENSKLLELSGNSVQLPDKVIDIIRLEVSEQETICKLQLILLRNNSIIRELTLEEARKVEIFSKILVNIENSNKPKEAQFKKLSDTELLKELENDSQDES